MSSGSPQQEVMPESAGALATWVAGIAVGVYLAVALWMPERGFWIYDTALKFIQVLAIAEHGQLALDWAGRQLDPDLDFGPLQWGFYALVDDEIYSAYSPVFAILTVPFYKLLGARGLSVLPLVGGLAALPAVWRMAGMVGGRGVGAINVRVLSVFAVAFATPLWFYSMTFWEHAPAVGLSCWCVWACVVYAEAPSAKHAALLGALAALPIYFRPENYLFAAVVLMFAAWTGRGRIREILVLGVACVVALLPLWIFHMLALGHPLGLHITNQGWGDASLAAYLAERGEVATRLLVNLHANTSWSIASVVPFYGALALGYAYRARAPQWLVLLACVTAFASACLIATGYLNAPRPMNWLIGANGVFAASPFLILAFLRFDDEASDQAARSRRTLLWISIAYALLYAAFIPEVNSKGIHWGCRFLLPIFPLLAVLASQTVVHVWERSVATAYFSKASLSALLVVSVGFQVYSLVMLHDRKAFTAKLNTRVLDRNAEIVVTDLWFMPIDLVDVFFERPVFHSPAERRAALLARTEEAGVQTTLFVSSTLRSTAPRGSEVVSDGWLNFSPVSLMERRSAGQILGQPDTQ